MVRAVILEIIVIGALASAGGGFFAWRNIQKRVRPQLRSADQALLERTVRDVRTDDIVQQGGRDWLVEGVLQYDEDGHAWRSARVSDSGQQRWLLVGLDRGPVLTVRLLSDAKLDLSGYPPETLEHDGSSFKLAQRGTATATIVGQIPGLPPHDGSTIRCRWWRYQAAGEKVIIVEQWGETFRVLAGETLRPDDVELLGAT
jgi:hypothetical protein